MNPSFLNPLILIPAISGLIFILAGVIMIKFPPRKINSFYGYRTNSSMKNKERWDFAQRKSAMEMIKLGGLLSLSGSFGLLFKFNSVFAICLGLGLMISMVILLFTRVEKAIKEEFGDS